MIAFAMIVLQMHINDNMHVNDNKI